MIKRLQHFGVTVSDGRRSDRFYSKIIGFPGIGSIVQGPEKSLIGKHLGAPKVRISWHQRGYGAVELFSFPEIKRENSPSAQHDYTRIGATRLAFRAQSLDKFKNNLLKNGVDFEMKKDVWGEEYLSFSDPDGISLAVYGEGAGGIELERASINVISLDESINFYKDVLGLSDVKEVRFSDAHDLDPTLNYKGPVRIARVGIDGKGVELIEFSDIVCDAVDIEKSDNETII